MATKSQRLAVLKTYKLYIGGKFPRSESGRYLTAMRMPGSSALGHYCHASRKDFRDAVVAARKAQAGWAKSSAYLRGQILYRAAEMLESRAAELEGELQKAGLKAADARKEVAASVDRLVHYAGWTDKFAAVFGSANPVTSPHFNFTVPEPTGVLVVACPDAPALLPLVSLIAPAIVPGNAVIALASETAPLPAITFAEILATSDLPGGVVNILTGNLEELAPHFASHMDVNAIVDGAEKSAQSLILEQGTAANLKRYSRRSVTGRGWFGAEAESPYWIQAGAEFKTTWHPIGV